MPIAVTPEQLIDWLERPQLSELWLRQLGVQSNPSIDGHLRSLKASPISIEVLAAILSRVSTLLPETNADRVLASLLQIVGSERCPTLLASTIARNSQALSFLMQSLAYSHEHAKWLVDDPSIIENLLDDAGQPTSLEFLCEKSFREIDVAKGDFRTCVDVIRRIQRRELLRIAQGDLIQNHRFETVSEQNTFLAEAILRATIRAAKCIQRPRLGLPPKSSRFVVIGLGPLGGSELDYSGNLELAFLYDLGKTVDVIGGGKTTGPKSVAIADYYQRLTETILALLRDAKDQGVGYHIKIRNATSAANVAMRMDDAWKFYDTHGETWDRLRFVKARPVAGDISLGVEFLSKIESTVYQRYLNQIQITSIKTFRRTFQRTPSNMDPIDIVDGAGGIVDIELVTQFLQLLNGGDLPDIRVDNSIKALRLLNAHGCLTDGEMTQLKNNYIFLRIVQHRLQIFSGRSQNTLPMDPSELINIAHSVGFSDLDPDTLVQKLHDRIVEATSQNHVIVRRLSFDAFGSDNAGSPIVDLILNPSPRQSVIDSVLLPYGFHNGEDTYHSFLSLATEKTPFLSKLRCRHFLASIATKLLPLIASTPDADDTLAELDRVSHSLGGKGTLWELFHSHPQLMELYVRLCAACPYLSGILIRNPGMIDALMDSLVLTRLPSHAQLMNEATNLCQGAEDIEPILHGFKNANHLSVGVRDIWGKDDIRTSTGTLADIAEACLQQVILREYDKLVPRLGIPTLPDGLLDDRVTPPSPSTECASDMAAQNSEPIGLPQDEGDADLVVLGLGKLGGREPNYHSDLDVLFVYEADGSTRHPTRSRDRETTTNQHFFSELAQRVTRVMNRLGPWGRLYEIDSQFSTGRTKVISIARQSLSDFVSEKSSVSHRQLLCKARPVFGTRRLRARTISDIHHAIRMASAAASNDPSTEIREIRSQLEMTASPRNLKRAVGGTVDIESIVQMLQLRHVNDHPELLTPGTLDAIEALHRAGVFDDKDAVFFAESYAFLRSVEARLRLMGTVARHDLPNEPAELNKLAFLLNLESGSEVERRCELYRSENRRRFECFFAAAPAEK